MIKPCTESSTVYYDLFASPAGEIVVVQDQLGVRHIDFQEGAVPLDINPLWQRDSTHCSAARQQILEYFAGHRTRFDLPLAPEGTEFQKRVWARLAQIPFGETRSYGDIATELGKPSASRAVGMANGRNPISIVIPCHRVVGSSRKLTGYRGGIPLKTKLLTLEGLRICDGTIEPTGC